MLVGWWLLGLLVLATLAVWLANERSYARLQAYKRELAAKGEQLAVADHIPKLPPAASNAAPAFLLAAGKLNGKKLDYFLLPRVFPTARIQVTWQCEELPWGDKADLWPELITHVDGNRAALADIRVALERGELAFEWDYAKGYAMEFPELGRVKTAVNELAFATIVDLRMGRPDEAFAHWLALSRLARQQPMPLGVFLHLAGMNRGYIAMAVTWEALQFSGWNDAQLRQLQSAWQSWDVREAWLTTANLDRAIAVDYVARCRDNPSLLFVSILTYHWDPRLDFSENLSFNWGIFKFRTGENLMLEVWRAA